MAKEQGRYRERSGLRPDSDHISTRVTSVRSSHAGMTRCGSQPEQHLHPACERESIWGVPAVQIDKDEDMRAFDVLTLTCITAQNIELCGQVIAAACAENGGKVLKLSNYFEKVLLQ